MVQPADDQLMTVEEWAALIGVGRSTAYRRVGAEEIEVIPVGSGKEAKLRISWRAHRAYLAAHSKPGPRTTRRRAA